MNSKLFKDYDDMLAECKRLIIEDEDDSHDRAAIGAFYNGRETMSENDARREGIKEITNHLLGYDSLAASKEQITSTVVKSPTTFVIDIQNLPVEQKDQWSMQITQYFNDAINGSRRYRPVHESCAGEATLYGSTFYTFMDPYDWCPTTSRPLVPQGTGTLASEVPYAVVPDFLNLSRLYDIQESAERMDKSGYSSKWNMDAISACIEFLESNTGLGATAIGNTSGLITAEERELQSRSGLRGSNYRSEIPVFYVYQTRMEEEGRPVDCTLLARFTPDFRSAFQKKTGQPADFMLYDRERMFDSPESWLHPMFLDTQLGGKLTWHRVMGLGRLNYDPDVDTERFFNAAMQGSMEQLLRTYQVTSSADLDMVERWAGGSTASNVLPEGLNIVETGKSAGFQYAFNTIQMLRAVSQNHGNMALSNSGGSAGGAKQVNELEVQALERQGRNAEAISNRIDQVYDVQKGIGERMFKAFISADILPCDKGYPEIRYFQQCLKDAKIPIKFLREMRFGRPKNYCLKVNRVAGDGDKVRETMTNQILMSWLPRFSPEAQQVIMRRVVASATNDYQLSEELLPNQKKPDFNQQERAQNEDQTMIQRALLQYISPIRPDDLNMVHIPEHFADMQALLTAGQQGTWTQVDAAAFQSIGQHVMQHIQMVDGVDHQLFKQLMDQVQRFSQVADGLTRNMQRQQQSQAAPMTQNDQVKAQLAQQRLQLDAQKQQDLVSHRQTMAELAYHKEGRATATDTRRMAIDENNQALMQLNSDQSALQQKIDNVMAGQGTGKTPLSDQQQ